MNKEVIIKLIQTLFLIEITFTIIFIIRQGWSEKKTRDYIINERTLALKSLKLLLLSLPCHIPEFKNLTWFEKLLMICFYFKRFLVFLYVEAIMALGFFIYNEIISVLVDVMFFVLFLLDYILEEFLLWCLNLFEHLEATDFSDDRLESIFFYTLVALVFFYSLNPTEEKKIIFIVETMISGLEDIEVVNIILKALIIFLMMHILASLEYLSDKNSSKKKKKRKDAVNEMKSALDDIRLLVLSLLSPDDIPKFLNLTWLEKLLKIFYCCKRIVSACYIFVKNIP